MNKIFLILFVILFSCTDDEFTQTNTGESKNVDPVKVNFEEKCSNFAPPPVDILLVVDNSGSVNFLTVDLKAAVTKVISMVSKFYDYRIYVVPLLLPHGETLSQKRSYQVITSTPYDIPITAQVVGVNQLQMPPIYNTGGEKGFYRVADIIRQNSPLSDLCYQYGDKLNHTGIKDGKLLCLDASCGYNGKTCSTQGTSLITVNDKQYRAELVNNEYYRVWLPSQDNSIYKNDYIFRKGSHLISILISNGDDSELTYDYTGQPIANPIDNRKQELLQIRNELQSTQFRFLSAVNHTKCGSVVRDPGDRYSAMSSQIQSAQGISDNSGDSYNLCSNNLETIFTGIARAIEKFKVGHVYKYWPLGSVLDFDPNKLSIKKKISGQTLVNGDSSNGFTVVGGVGSPTFHTNFNIREYPPVSQLNPAEKYSGYFVELHGGGKAIYPECLVVRKEEFTKYYGYIVLDREPDPATIKITVEGKSIPASSSNGWTYLGFKDSINVLVNSPNSPADLRTGYVVQLHGSAIFDNEQAKNVQVIYKVAPFKSE